MTASPPSDRDDAREGTSEGQEEKAELKFESRREMFYYAFLRIKETRRYWLLPVLALLVLIGFFLNIFAGYNVLPAIYSLIP